MTSLVATLLRLFSIFFVAAAEAIRRLVGWARPSPVQECPEAVACSTELPVARCGEQRGAGRERCVFCLGGMEEGDEVRVLRCQHLFHRCCLDRWLATRPGATCPLCRGKLLAVTATKRAGEEEEERSIEGMCMVMLMAYVHSHTSVPAV
ncbi:14 kDa zinc-binding protein [Hordeum vulgare]|uniref:RING-type domain-containing protein n=1 Tax=Hordeum vulgare subsp. vulgare TaxID=112509 RepID=A0A8I6XK09_HORVV|nr:E3 ubiquitin-protein ligase RHA2A-like [Hordeum vulgare subsp. vulgare]KAE8816387.1 14 kDa zinc-binding protein [Hordeum vulgare]KAI4994330.1 hypothetical protein ZWY2020_029378 [Hordeum vulgare]